MKREEEGRRVNEGEEERRGKERREEVEIGNKRRGKNGRGGSSLGTTRKFLGKIIQPCNNNGKRTFSAGM